MVKARPGLISGARLRESAEIHRHSGWVIPLGVAALTLLLCGLLLLYYLRPLPGALRDSGPVASPAEVSVSVRGVRFHIPANYIESRSARKGGEQDVLPLIALLPDMEGYSDADGAVFANNAADSPVLHLLIKADNNGMDPASRFARIYRPYIADPGGTAGPFGLTLYGFRPGTGYGRDDLFVATDDGPLLLLCERPAQDIASPNCLAVDRPIAHGVTLSYRFKRAQLGRWRQIDRAVTKLVASFMR